MPGRNRDPRGIHLFVTTTSRPGELFEYIRDELGANVPDQSEGVPPVAAAVQVVDVAEAFCFYVYFAGCPDNPGCPILPTFHIWEP